MDTFTLFVEKVEIATIFLHNVMFGCYLQQIGRYFHLMRIVFIRVEITARFHQKPPLKQSGFEQNNIQCMFSGVLNRFFANSSNSTWICK